MNGDVMGWLKGLTFNNLLNVSYMFGILSDPLYKGLKEINEKRNLIMHNLIVKNEKITSIDLERHYNLCKISQENLVNEFVNYTRDQMIKEKIFNEVMKGLREKGTFKDDNY